MIQYIKLMVTISNKLFYVDMADHDNIDKLTLIYKVTVCEFTAI